MSKLSDYTIEHAGIDWSELLASWAWLLPRELTVWLMNRFGDLFLVFKDGSVQMLDMGRGSLERVADSQEDFARRIHEGNNANEWLMIPLVNRLVETGMVPGPGECYSYIRLPILGGDYTTENTRIMPVAQHYKAFGPIHEKLKDIPDGTKIKFEVTG